MIRQVQAFECEPAGDNAWAVYQVMGQDRHLIDGIVLTQDGPGLWKLAPKDITPEMDNEDGVAVRIFYVRADSPEHACERLRKVVNELNEDGYNLSRDDYAASVKAVLMILAALAKKADTLPGLMIGIGEGIGHIMTEHVKPEHVDEFWRKLRAQGDEATEQAKAQKELMTGFTEWINKHRTPTKRLNS